MRGVPKVIDLTKDNVNEQIDDPNNDISHSFSHKKSKEVNRTFIQGRKSVF